MFDIKVLALDLDGTLTNDQKLVTPRTRAALDAAIEKGVTVVLASGRPTAGIQPLAEELGLDKKGGCILSYNGGKIVDCRTGETLYQRQFPPELIPAVCAFAAETDTAVLSYDKTGVVSERPEDPWVQREAAINRSPAQKVEHLADYLDYPVCKLLMTVPPARMAEVEALAQARFGGQIGVFRSCDFFLELVPLGVGKDTSLDAVLRARGLGPEHLMAVGDGMNDLPMIRYAGMGVAMGNAVPEVKQAAKYVTADNEHDGVGLAVEKFILEDPQ